MSASRGRYAARSRAAAPRPDAATGGDNLPGWRAALARTGPHRHDARAIDAERGRGYAGGVTASVLLWDFGDTLADERWMRVPPRGCADWEQAWSATMAELADAWNIGAVAASEVYAALAARTGMSPAAVAEHARTCCQRIAFTTNAWHVARQRLRPQALVTVNPDLFADIMVPYYRLTGVFDAVVISASEATADKTELCLRALDRLSFNGDRSTALLIDNREDLVAGWRSVGGAAYWLRNDLAFRRDVREFLRDAVLP